MNVTFTFLEVSWIYWQVALNCYIKTLCEAFILVKDAYFAVEVLNSSKFCKKFTNVIQITLKLSCQMQQLCVYHYRQPTSRFTLHNHYKNNAVIFQRIKFIFTCIKRATFRPPSLFHCLQIIIHCITQFVFNFNLIHALI